MVARQLQTAQTFFVKKVQIVPPKKNASFKETSSKLRGKGGGNTLSNEKCFVDRTAMIQSAQHSSDLGECFIYSKSMLTTHRKVSKGF